MKHNRSADVSNSRLVPTGAKCYTSLTLKRHHALIHDIQYMNFVEYNFRNIIN